MPENSSTWRRRSSHERFVFDRFLLASELHRDGKPLAITPKSLAVLRVLVERAGELVTKDELWEAVWPRVIVTDGALSVCIAEARRVLGDDARKPRYIATVPKRGFRFVCPVMASSRTTPSAASGILSDGMLEDAYPFVGRASELETLHEALAIAGHGRRRLVLISGEPGIGKTSLLNTFKAAIAERPAIYVLSGQCSAHFGPSEPYLPLLDALGRTCRDERGAAMVRCLARHAPLWLAQLPGVTRPPDIEIASAGARPLPQRMLRELAEALEAFAVETTVVLCLEDLHWSDNATLDWLNFVTRRDTSARLLVLATFREAPAIRRGHPLLSLAPALRVLPQCTELALGPLSVDAIAGYLGRRLRTHAQDEAPASPISALAGALHARTSGNPLFVVNVVDHLTALALSGTGEERIDAMTAALAERHLPDDLRQSIELQLGGLSRDELDLLEIASIVGETFFTAAIAAVLGIDGRDAEIAFEALALETRVITGAGLAEWPDGTVASYYTFRHGLYRELLYARIPPGRRARFHRLVGQYLELAFESRTGEVASEIALHYERGHASLPAARFYVLAGETALGRAATEAIDHFEKARSLLKEVPEGHARDVAELQVLTRLGPALMVLKGWSATGVGSLYDRANELAATIDGSADLVPALAGIWMFNMTSARYDLADSITERLFHIARTTSNEDVLLQAHHAKWPILLFRGDLVSTSEQVEIGLRLYDYERHKRHALLYMGHDPAVCAHACQIYASWALGFADTAAVHEGKAMALARRLAHAPTLAFALSYGGLNHAIRGDAERVIELADELSSLAEAQSLQPFLAIAQLLKGWAQSQGGNIVVGLAQMQSGFDLLSRMGTRTWLPVLMCLYAESLLHARREREALVALERAIEIAEHSGEHGWDSPILHLRGVIEAGSGALATAEASMRAALRTARLQHARSWELRAATTLARIWAEQGKRRESIALLLPVYSSFTEGFGVADLHDAKSLLDDLL